ncbi:MAG TPA: hypothetical protein PLD14_01655 [Candidatus Pacearchaeota archaeon]|nr:hypothetical protein [Candidatus Pacearchaeota archaeon]HPR79904.1 hypothetical protein [Candidatus Pacearchaeota archaeon]
MKINKIKIKESVFDINLVFYNFLKKITQAKFTDNQVNDLLSIYFSNSKENVETLKELFYDYIETKIDRADLSHISDVISEITEDTIDIFLFSLKLNLIKDLLLQEAKIAQTIKTQELEGLNQLSMAYDKVSTQVAYATRISGALLSLLFFEKLEKGETNFISDSTETFLKSLVQKYTELSKKGIEPNQIFMLLFSESINQSIISSAGTSYEDRIKNILIAMGIPNENIEKTHDNVDSSTEFDFFFEYKKRQYGIGAKRTLRERYKQFIKTVQMSELDVMIEITLGTDLRENIANAIRAHGVYLFVADEVYEAKEYLQKIEGIFPASKLSLALLEKLK